MKVNKCAAFIHGRASVGGTGNPRDCIVSGTPKILPLVHIVYAIQVITPMKRRGTDTLPIGACFFFFTKACRPSRLGPRDFDMSNEE